MRGEVESERYGCGAQSPVRIGKKNIFIGFGLFREHGEQVDQERRREYHRPFQIGAGIDEDAIDDWRILHEEVHEGGTMTNDEESLASTIIGGEGRRVGIDAEFANGPAVLVSEREEAQHPIFVVVDGE